MTKTIKNYIDEANFYYVNPEITDENFKMPENPSKEDISEAVIIPLESSKCHTSEEFLEKIKSAGCRPATIHKLLEWQKLHAIDAEKYKYYTAFGSISHDSNGNHRVPRVNRYSDGDWRFDLGVFEFGWDGDDCLLCFRDSSLDTQSSDILFEGSIHANQQTFKNEIADLLGLPADFTDAQIFVELGKLLERATIHTQ